MDAGTPIIVGNMALQFRHAQDFSITIRYGYQSRNEAVACLLVEALREVKYELRNSFSIEIFTTDQPPDLGRNVLAFCSSGDNDNIIRIPDFIFWNWPEIGVFSYPDTTASMVQAGKAAPVFADLFWIGNPETHPIRKKLVELSRTDNRITAIGVAWRAGKTPEHWSRSERMATQGSNFVSLPDHCLHKYLIDLEGVGYSGRLKILLFSGRPLFVQERRWEEFYFQDLQPFVHFIPVSNDLSDLSRQIGWAEAHPDECNRIAQNAQSFAMSQLTRDAAICSLRKTLRELSDNSI